MGMSAPHWLPNVAGGDRTRDLWFRKQHLNHKTTGSKVRYLVIYPWIVTYIRNVEDINGGNIIRHREETKTKPRAAVTKSNQHRDINYSTKGNARKGWSPSESSTKNRPAQHDSMVFQTMKTVSLWKISASAIKALKRQTESFLQGQSRDSEPPIGCVFSLLSPLPSVAELFTYSCLY